MKGVEKMTVILAAILFLSAIANFFSGNILVGIVALLLAIGAAGA